MWLRLWLKVNLTFLDLDRANLSNKCIYLVSLSVWVSRRKWSALFSHTHTHTEGKRLLKLTTAARERARLIQPVPSHPLPLSRSRCLPPSLSPSVSTGWLSLNAEVYTQLSCCRRNQDERWCDSWAVAKLEERCVGESDGAKPRENTKATSDTVAGLDFRLAYGFSGQRRSAGFRSENQQVNVKKL